MICDSTGKNAFRNEKRQQCFLPRWILLQAAFTRSFSQYYRPGENREEFEVAELT